MEKVLDKIYKDVLYYEPDMVVMERKIDAYIVRMLEENAKPKDEDRLREMMYQVALEAETLAYWKGFRACLRLLAGAEAAD